MIKKDAPPAEAPAPARAESPPPPKEAPPVPPAAPAPARKSYGPRVGFFRFEVR